MKRIISILLIVCMFFTLGVSTFAEDKVTELTATDGIQVYDKDGKALITLNSNLSGDLEFDTVVYLDVEDLFKDQNLEVSDLNKDRNVRFSSRKETGSKYISKIALMPEKKLEKLSSRGTYIAFTPSDSMTLDEEKVRFTVKFRIHEDGVLEKGSVNGDLYQATFTFWMSNPKVRDEIKAGKRGIYDPLKNDEAEIVWSDENNDIVKLKFDSNSDTNKMFVKMSTKIIEDVYIKYGDPVNADLYFRSFPGMPQIPATSRASLFLYNPWENDDRLKPYNVYIYTYVDNVLTNVSPNFIWNETESAWETRTRMLGTYIISDSPLKADVNTTISPMAIKSESTFTGKIKSINGNIAVKK